MDTTAAILDAIHDDPADEASWLALADWLEESGRPEQAELLRLHRAVRPGPAAPAFDANRRRIQELLRAGVKPCVPTLTNSAGLAFALIPAGTFVMGSPESEADRDESEGPQHEVEITRPFYLGVYPVTQGEFLRVMRYDPSDFREEGEHEEDVEGMDTSAFPVENVTWHAAVDFCKRLSNRAAEKKAGRAYRLPTEAEWEYACRAWLGGDPFNLGRTIPSRLANYRGTHPYRGSRKGKNLNRPCPVGLYPPNAFGLYDMHGQVWEWCADVYAERYYSRSPRKDPPGPRGRGYRVQRGGCWGAIGACCRSASRTCDDPDGAQYCFGFRVAMTPGKRA